MAEQTSNFSVRLFRSDIEKLMRIAKETDRSKGAVIRMLINLADTPEAKLILGDKRLKVEND